MHETLVSIARTILNGGKLTSAHALALVPFAASELLDVCAIARLAASARKPFTCGIVNAKSGLCGESCAFCAQSAHYDTGVAVHPLIEADDMLLRAERLAEAGADFMGMVTSGTGPGEGDFERLCRMAESISRRVNIRLCASLGVLGPGQAKRLREAGFTSYHHNLETAKSYYPAVCPSHLYDQRVATVRQAKAAGLRVCSGGLFGLGESWTQRVELSAALDDLEVDCIPVNFLHPIAGTPLAGREPPPPNEALAVVALLRLMHPNRDIVICGGRSTSLGRYETLLFAAGASGLMIGDYLTTAGSPTNSDMEMLATLGLR